MVRLYGQPVKSAYIVRPYSTPVRSAVKPWRRGYCTKHSMTSDRISVCFGAVFLVHRGSSLTTAKDLPCLRTKRVTNFYLLLVAQLNLLAVQTHHVRRIDHKGFMHLDKTSQRRMVH